MSFFKDNPDLAQAACAPDRLLACDADAGRSLQRVVLHHNRIGGVLAAAAQGMDLHAADLLAVWAVESGPFGFTPGQPVLRFENHKFFQHWGVAHTDAFDAHFQFGGRGSVEGKPWTGHRFRAALDGEWQSFHGTQAGEYGVFDFARSQFDAEAACLSASFGGPQILGSNHQLLGYPTAQALFTAFGRDENAQVCGFLDYCKAHDLISALAARDWQRFAAGYNGPGQAEDYARLIAEAHGVARTALGDDA
jgi:N-acetylmuramidase